MADGPLGSLRAGAALLRRTLAGLDLAPLTAGELAERWRAAPAERRPGPPDGGGEIARLRERMRSGQLDRREPAEDARSRAASDEFGAFIRVVRPAAPVEGPLAGIPFTVKDLVDVAGLPTTSGSLFERTPTESAPAWAALQSAGAVLIGKTNLHEWAFGLTGENPHFGTVRNPVDRQRIAGGSSSGSAAALASGIGVGSLGTDTGGSIRIPAALTGVAGLKPSFGRVSAAGVTPLSWSLDHVGPMARSAADLDLIWSVLAGVPERAPGGSGLDGVRIGVAENFFGEKLIPAAAEATRAAVEALAGLGAAPVPVQVPEAELAAPARNLIAFVEVAAFHRERLANRPGDFGADVRQNLIAGGHLAGDDLMVGLMARRLVTDGFSQALSAVDALVVPTTPAAAPRIGSARLGNGEPVRSGLMRLVGPFNLTGHPVVQVPAGADSGGLPLGVQIVGPHGGEDRVLWLARWLEHARAG